MTFPTRTQEAKEGPPPNVGTFVLSLDFELMWGVRDKRTGSSYGQNIIGARQAIPRLLSLFSEREIACTWAAVGFLLFKNKRELLAGLPEQLPRYSDPNLTPYPSLVEIGDTEETDPFHFGFSLIERILDTPLQELATHTFSHFYCLEEGGEVKAFRCDLEAVLAASDRIGRSPRSIVFPRNQVSKGHLRVCKELGFSAFRGTEEVWFQRPSSNTDLTFVSRGARLLESHLSLGSHHDFEVEQVEGLANVRSSRYLRPWGSPPLLGGLRRSRIRSAMEAAAKKGTCFHLWWHPHNFGTNLEANLQQIAWILDDFRDLQEMYGMRSMTVQQVGELALGSV